MSARMCDDFLRDLMSGPIGVAIDESRVNKRLETCMVCKTNKNYSMFGMCRKCDSYLYKLSVKSGDETSGYQSTL